MKTVPTKQVSSTLRELGFAPRSHGNGTSQTVWADPNGRTCRVPYCGTDLKIAHLYSLGRELESKGICPRRQFMAGVQGR